MVIRTYKCKKLACWEDHFSQVYSQVCSSTASQIVANCTQVFFPSSKMFFSLLYLSSAWAAQLLLYICSACSTLPSGKALNTLLSLPKAHSNHYSPKGSSAALRTENSNALRHTLKLSITFIT